MECLEYDEEKGENGGRKKPRVTRKNSLTPQSHLGQKELSAITQTDVFPTLAAFIGQIINLNRYNRNKFNKDLTLRQVQAIIKII